MNFNFEFKRRYKKRLNLTLATWECNALKTRYHLLIVSNFWCITAASDDKISSARKRLSLRPSPEAGKDALFALHARLSISWLSPLPPLSSVPACLAF